MIRPGMLTTCRSKSSATMRHSGLIPGRTVRLMRRGSRQHRGCPLRSLGSLVNHFHERSLFEAARSSGTRAAVCTDIGMSESSAGRPWAVLTSRIWNVFTLRTAAVGGPLSGTATATNCPTVRTSSGATVTSPVGFGFPPWIDHGCEIIRERLTQLPARAHIDPHRACQPPGTSGSSGLPARTVRIPRSRNPHELHCSTSPRDEVIGSARRRCETAGPRPDRPKKVSDAARRYHASNYISETLRKSPTVGTREVIALTVPAAGPNADAFGELMIQVEDHFEGADARTATRKALTGSRRLTPLRSSECPEFST